MSMIEICGAIFLLSISFALVALTILAFITMRKM